MACRSSARAFDSRLLRFSEKQTLHVAIAYLAVQRVALAGEVSITINAAYEGTAYGEAVLRMERVTEGAAEGAVGPGTHRVLRIVHISSRKKLLVAAIAYRVSRLCVADCGRGSDLRRTAHCALCLRIVCCGRGGSLEAGCVLRIAFAHCVRAVVQRAAYCVLRLRVAYGQCEAGAYRVWRLRIAYRAA